MENKISSNKRTTKAKKVKRLELDVDAHTTRSSSSLVRRARLIRRRTTTQYDERMHQMDEHDDVVIYQILIIRLRSRDSATEFERACVNAPAAFVPSVVFAAPPLASNFDEFPPPLFYPDFMKSSLQRREQVEAYRVVLTDEKGNRKFAYCFKFLWNSSIEYLENPSTSQQDEAGDYSVLVIASYFPYEGLFHRLTADFVRNVCKNSANIHTMCQDLLNLRHTTSENSCRYAKYELCENENGESGGNITNGISECEPNASLSWPRAALSTTTIARLGAETTAFIFLSLLAEKRVIVTGANITEVARAVQSFVRLLAPLEWPHTLIPIVPDSHVELCFNPTPYICGILRYNLSYVKELLCPMPGEMEENVTVVDMERGVILPCLLPIDGNDSMTAMGDAARLKSLLKFASTMIFPRAVVVELVNAFRAILPVKNPVKADYKIEKHVMIFYAKMFGHFARFGADICATRARKRFVQAHPCADTRLFLTWFVENGLLQSFIFNQTNNANKPMEDVQLKRRFAEILKKYSPPVDKAGKRHKAKSIVWRILNR